MAVVEREEEVDEPGGRTGPIGSALLSFESRASSYLLFITIGTAEKPTVSARSSARGE